MPRSLDARFYFIQFKTPKIQHYSIMDRLMELKGHSDQLAAAVKSLIDNYQGSDSSDQLGASAGADIDKHETLSKRAKSNILASTVAIKSLVSEPTDFLQDFARQVSR